jgi:hypothetical protein
MDGWGRHVLDAREKRALTAEHADITIAAALALDEFTSTSSPTVLVVDVGEGRDDARPRSR